MYVAPTTTLFHCDAPNTHVAPWGSAVVSQWLKSSHDSCIPQE